MAWLLAGSGVCGAGIVVDPGGQVEAIVADPLRDVFYASLSTNEVVLVTTGGSVPIRVPVPGLARQIAVAPDGSELYVGLRDSNDVAVFELPGVTYRTTFELSATAAGLFGLAAKPGRLYAASDNGLSVVDTTNGEELYFGEPSGFLQPFVGSLLALSRDGRLLYSLATRRSPSSVFAWDVSTNPPTYAGEQCCRGCLGSDGRALELSPDGSYLYVAPGGGRWSVPVLRTTPILVREHTILLGPEPSAIAPSAGGDRVYVGYSGPTLAAVRTSDWLVFHVESLQGLIEKRGLALSSGQETLAAVIRYQGIPSNRIELVDVTAMTVNRGGVRLRALDEPTGVPAGEAYMYPSLSLRASDYVDVTAGRLGLAPLLPGPLEFTLLATGHAGLELDATVVAGNWTDLGDVVMTRTGGLLPRPVEVCATHAAHVGTSTHLQVHGLGFLPGTGFEVTSQRPEIAIEDSSWTDWSTADITVHVDLGLLPGYWSDALEVINPDAQYGTGGLLVVEDHLFADGFETGDTSAWSATIGG